MNLTVAIPTTVMTIAGAYLGYVIVSNANKNQELNYNHFILGPVIFGTCGFMIGYCFTNRGNYDVYHHYDTQPFDIR